MFHELMNDYAICLPSEFYFLLSFSVAPKGSMSVNFSAWLSGLFSSGTLSVAGGFHCVTKQWKIPHEGVDIKIEGLLCIATHLTHRLLIQDYKFNPGEQVRVALSLLEGQVEFYWHMQGFFRSSQADSGDKFSLRRIL
ncbi:hypothetical protein O6P43_031994 [Quillaja saponaria]|uniref:Uncharacterized protein n=1 Tax=Quillaja saponaria TaxID=32244 RepID=A0AAD7KWL0_QUISA|nr:hypothetical protein O6P43_031994 [Quillaja saponaria]